MTHYNPFFVMPGSALLDLREELELIEDKEAGETLARYGYRAGVGLIGVLDLHVDDVSQIKEVLPQIWSETGLSRIKVTSANAEEIVVQAEESVEALHGRSCDFARGYLSGIVSSLLDRRYQAIEKECISKGKHGCVLVLTPTGDEVAVKAAGKKEPVSYELEAGYSYIIESEDPYAGFEMFSELVTHGYKGMSVVREYPEKLRERYTLGDAPMLWLSYERDMKFAREPTNIPLIYSEVKAFLDNAQDGVVLISGIEYLISQSTFLKVLKFLQLLNENVAVKDAVLLVPFSPQALSTREVKLLEREMRVLQPAKS